MIGASHAPAAMKRLLLCVFGLLIHVMFARERPSPRLWWKVGVAAVVNLSVLAFLFLFLTANNLTLRR